MTETHARVLTGMPPVTPPTLIEPVGTHTLEGNYAGQKYTVEVPVFDEMSFSAEAREMIPPRNHFYVDFDNRLYEVAYSLMHGQTPMLWGEPGSGKTQLFIHLASIMRLPCHVEQFEEGFDVTDLIGNYELSPGGTYWVDGTLTRWITEPCMWVGDEYNAAPNGVQFKVRPILDGRNSLVVSGFDGRVKLRNPHFYFGCTGNPPWSPRNTGVMPLAEADSDRLSHHPVDYPSVDIEFRILLQQSLVTKIGVTPEQMSQSVHLWKLMRDATERGDTTLPAGTRSLMNFNLFLDGMPPKAAFGKVYDRAEHQELKAFHELLDATDLSASCEWHADTLTKLVTKGVCKRTEGGTKVTIDPKYLELA